jgi:hypothetical protein
MCYNATDVCNNATDDICYDATDVCNNATDDVL